MRIQILLPVVLLLGTKSYAQYGDYSVRVEVEGNGFAHFTEVYFEDGLNPTQSEPTLGWDPCCDANLIIANQNQPHVYTEVVEPPYPANNHRIAINGLPHIFEHTQVPLDFWPGQLAAYDFTVKELYRLPTGMGVELEDLSLEVTQNLLLDSTYSTWGAPSDDEQRFMLHFYPLITGVDQLVTKPEVQYSLSQGQIVLATNTGAISDVRLYDLSGRVIIEENMVDQAASTTIPTSGLPKGVYIAELLLTSGDKLTTKISY